VVSELSAVAGKDAHPLFEEREAKRAAIIVITNDRGLAGAFNSNVIKARAR
jgi:F-type H+-transporting ATPase subunit gamma